MTDVPRKVTTTAIHSKKSKTFVLYDEDHTLGNVIIYQNGTNVGNNNITFKLSV